MTNVFALSSRPVLTPLQIHSQYADALSLTRPDGRALVLPGVIGTVFFERGSKPDVRQGLLACFDRFEAVYGTHLRGGKSTDLGKFSKKNAAGVQAIRQAIVQTAPDRQVSVAWASATDQDTAAEYQIKTLTNDEQPKDYRYPGGTYVSPKGSDGGQLSYVKFQVPLAAIVDAEGLAQYEAFLHFICETLPVRGGYGGLSSLLPYAFHRFMPQEYELARQFSGLEIDTYGFVEADAYCTRSYEGESVDHASMLYPYLRPGCKVHNYGFIKGVNWYTLLGDVFVERLGGQPALEAALARPYIGVTRIGQCVAVRAGPFPRLGAPEEGLPEPYVFVNRVLRVLRNPTPDAMHSFIPDTDHADLTASRHWQARFDLPDAPPLPPVPEIVPPPRPGVARAPRRAAYAGDRCPQTGRWQAPRLAYRQESVTEGEAMPGPASTETGAVVWYLVDEDGAL